MVTLLVSNVSNLLNILISHRLDLDRWDSDYKELCSKGVLPLQIHTGFSYTYWNIVFNHRPIFRLFGIQPYTLTLFRTCRPSYSSVSLPFLPFSFVTSHSVSLIRSSVYTFKYLWPFFWHSNLVSVILRVCHIPPVH